MGEEGKERRDEMKEKGRKWKVRKDGGGGRGEEIF